MRALLKHSPPKVYCPTTAYPHFSSILESWTKLQADTDRCTLTSVEPGDTIPLGSDSFARAFRSPHRIDCVGYTLFKRVRKLRPDLVGLPPEVIGRRARAGEDVHEHIQRAEICFPGDTTIDVLDQEPSVRRARVLLLECTFMEPKVSVRKARAGGHVHLDEISERADLFENEVILLTHFSRRYRSHEIEQAVNAKFPEKLRSRVRLLIHEDDE
jgi:ribonuclease Z